jgi:hypothetical protein
LLAVLAIKASGLDFVTLGLAFLAAGLFFEGWR